jgi:L-alanine-DL-glutamate epimerase-like enolase superfamily enzyme
MFAISDLDIALWDLAGKVAGKHLDEMLGTVKRPLIPAYASIPGRPTGKSSPEIALRRHGAHWRTSRAGPAGHLMLGASGHGRCPTALFHRPKVHMRLRIENLGSTHLGFMSCSGWNEPV